MAIKKNRDRTFRFSPISFEDYLALHAEDNRDENERNFCQRLKEAVNAKRAGQLCESRDIPSQNCRITRLGRFARLSILVHGRISWRALCT
jgi:hypothetical protein